MKRLISIIKHTPKKSAVFVTDIISADDDAHKLSKKLAKKNEVDLDRLHSNEEWDWLDPIDRHMLITLSVDGLFLPEYMQICYTYQIEPIVELDKDTAFDESINLHSSTIKPSNTEVGLAKMAEQLITKNLALAL